MTFAKILTELPGPNSVKILEKKDSVARAFGTFVPSIVDYAKGARVWDMDGNVFIDLAGGVGCLNVGHSHPKVVKTIQREVERFTHTDFTVIPYESYIELADRLCKMMPGNDLQRAAFFNSGTEAVENAIKIARKATGKRGIICFDGAFHGRTMLSLSLTSKVNPYKEKMGPFFNDIYRVPYPNPYRWNGTTDPEQVSQEAINSLMNLFITQIPPSEVAALIVEPIQGEAGFITPPKSYLQALQKICNEVGIIFIADEVQTGYGRTGEFLGSDYFQIEPDIITLGKSIAGGLPLSAVIGKKHIMDSAGDGAVGGTFVGNPISCAAGLAVLDIYEEEKLGDKARVIGNQIKNKINDLKEKTPLIGDIRGAGAMIAFELIRDHETLEPADEETLEIIQKCLQKGVILFKAGLYNNVIRFLVPLVISTEELAEALNIIEESVIEITEKYQSDKLIGAER
ncbi:4-aminobutyrate--2-oxoglutarate transaminase [Cytobacillus purgationiresistens]|uniref:(S)-3-amino-2-methylpropionate transaminase n=1 Tax=Cytobacillus purgationiresistens TaxID=863449 RepID=A0ABU0AP72_9BACI|nr:4-aminobutyrate--2-oxoglutarate transaminase [Cytobacillus purgationiresistens]MDQ0272995.1 4-aminobutyrate aminotransferase/(S)-3-amino-2-methylpropionate transaminase [Cytobacillus purgationiresistens]